MVLVCESNFTAFIFLGVLSFTENCFESFACYVIITPEKPRYNVTLGRFRGKKKTILFANYFSFGCTSQ